MSKVRIVKILVGAMGLSLALGSRAGTVGLNDSFAWESGRMRPSTNGWLSVRGHGGKFHARLTREMFRIDPAQPTVFTAETYCPPDYEGRQQANFWFETYDAMGKPVGNGPVGGANDGKGCPRGADGWRQVKMTLPAMPNATHVRVGCAAGARGDDRSPHTFLRNMRLSGLLPPANPSGVAVRVPADAFETFVDMASGTNVLHLTFERDYPRTFRMIPIAGGVRLEPFGFDYPCGTSAGIVFSVRSDGKRAQFYLNGDYQGALPTQGRLMRVAGAASASAVRFDCAKKDPRLEVVRLSPSDLAKATRSTYYSTSWVSQTNCCVRTVPAEQYVRAFVTCALDDDPKKDRAFTLRLSRYYSGRNAGRAFDGMAQTLVEFDTAKRTRVGVTTLGGKKVALWRVEVPLKLGEMPDIVFDDPYGDHLAGFEMNNLGRYLDLELFGRAIARRGMRHDERMKPDLKYKSAVTVYGVELERPGCEFRIAESHPGNIFANDDVPETGVDLRVRRPGAYRLTWTIRDAEDRVVRRGERTVTQSEVVRVDLAMPYPGWYGLDYALYDGKTPVFTHAAAFALLGRDTRTTEMGEGPYGTWDYGGGEYTCGDPDIVGEMLLKAGFRRSFGYQKYPIEMRRKWKISPVVLCHGYGNPRRDDAWFLEQTKRDIAENPHLDIAMILHEGYPWAYTMAPEMTGQKPTEETRWKHDTKEKQAERFKLAMRNGAFLRKNFPNVKITLGNTLACTELLAQLIRDGFPEEYADYMGLEVVGSTNLPERFTDAGIQSADLLYETAKAFGYTKWKVNNCFESNYHNEILLGADRTAAWYVRDLLLSHLWNFHDIFLGILADCGNGYSCGLWGQTGLCRRNPYHYPRKAYVAVATATKLLDAVTGWRILPTGDPCVYAVEYARRDGRFVTVFWTTRGEADAEIDVTGEFACADIYGRPFEPKEKRRFGNEFRRAKRYRLTVGESPCYLVSGPAAVTKVTLSAARRFPADALPPAARVVAKGDGSETMALRPTPDPSLEKKTGLYLPYRTKGEFELRHVTDETVGPCWEIELTKPDLTLSPLIREYAVAEFAEPIPLGSHAHTLGLEIKGNSGWGHVYFILEDAKGRRCASCGNAGLTADCYDNDGRLSLSFTGWNSVSFPIDNESEIYDLSTGSVDHAWESGRIGTNGVWKAEFGSPKGPAKLVGVAFSVPNRPLFLNARQPYRQAIRFKGVKAW